MERRRGQAIKGTCITKRVSIDLGARYREKSDVKVVKVVIKWGRVLFARKHRPLAALTP